MTGVCGVMYMYVLCYMNNDVMPMTVADIYIYNYEWIYACLLHGLHACIYVLCVGIPITSW